MADFNCDACLAQLHGLSKKHNICKGSANLKHLQRAAAVWKSQAPREVRKFILGYKSKHEVIDATIDMDNQWLLDNYTTEEFKI